MGRDLKIGWHDFYPIPRKVIKSRGNYTVIATSNPSSSGYRVVEEWQDNNVKYLIGTDKGTYRLFKRVVGTEWTEIIGEGKLEILKSRSLP